MSGLRCTNQAVILLPRLMLSTEKSLTLIAHNLFSVTFVTNNTKIPYYLIFISEIYFTYLKK
ncbi:hypothetical protein HMPREF0673_02577 [Leyella stercorea DSM 18206]|uniref:Uncharacterized protein n=1 Tax=Leyella stercorea DSM 18206 TaxID=1002367 RepID=G6B109_9BACT|nr:hypothetical protein HMPREF0673_02577 [Leyella stercorea DSM 18206]